MKILIVDDEPIARDGLAALFKDQPDLEVVGTAANGREAIRRIIDSNPDIVFLDIEMPDLNGFEVVRAIEPDRLPEIVFVTAFDEYALDAFKARAVDYILKPVDPVRLLETCRYVMQRRREQTDPDAGRRAAEWLTGKEEMGNRVVRIPVRIGQNVRPVSTEGILWIESDGNYVRLHLDGETLYHRATLKEMETVLPDTFRRISRFTIVNTDAVRNLQRLMNGTYAIKLSDGRTVTSSRRYRQSLDIFLEGK